MAASDYEAHLKSKLDEVDRGIRHATSMFEGGDIAEKSRALHELTRLRNRHDELLKRVEAAKTAGADQWSALHMSLKEEADALADTLEKWLTRT